MLIGKSIKLVCFVLSRTEMFKKMPGGLMYVPMIKEIP